MKKVLFVTTALIATASMAAADVRFSGYGRFGLDYNDANSNDFNQPGNGRSETNITSRLRLQIDMSTESDGGVEFGARYRIQAESRDNVPTTAVANGARFHASYGGFRLEVGNIAGSIDALPGLYLPTSSADTGIDGMGFHSNVANVNGVGGFFDFPGYSSAGAGVNGIAVIYSAGAFGAHLSYNTTNAAVGAAGTPQAGIVVGRPADTVNAHISYSFGDWTAALGVQDTDAVGSDKVVATLTGSIGAFGVGVAYAQNSDAGGPGVDIDKVRIYGSFDIGAASTILVWAANEDNPNPIFDGTSYGLNFSTDLGGGVSFDAGFVETQFDQTQAQAGVYFRF